MLSKLEETCLEYINGKDHPIGYITVKRASNSLYTLAEVIDALSALIEKDLIGCDYNGMYYRIKV